MNIRAIAAIILCKLLRLISRLLHRGGTAMPGRYALKICPQLLSVLAKNVKTVVITGTNGTVVAGVNAFGVVKVLDLEGNDVTAAEADAAAAAQSAAPVLATENLENNTAAAQATVAEGAVLTPVEGLNVTGTAIAAFVADVSGETQYVVITAPLGYSNETMKMITVFDAEGNVIFYKTLTELILHGEYYATHELTDESAYRQMFIGVNAGTYSDDMTLVAGATMTANAVASSFNSAFEALDLIKEVVA